MVPSFLSDRCVLLLKLHAIGSPKTLFLLLCYLSYILHMLKVFSNCLDFHLASFMTILMALLDGPASSAIQIFILY